MDGMTRRKWITGVAMGGAALGLAAMVTGCEETSREGDMKVRKNAEFYKDGKFDAEKAKKAYFDMMESYNYPIPKSLREGLWVLDFGLGRFTEVGMGGIFWINQLEKEGGYLGHEIYLLPGQMIPEHCHMKTEAAGPKVEGWHLRYGDVVLFGEGDPTPDLEPRIPESERKNISVHHGTHLAVGEVGKLNRAEARHFMVAGPKGCIVSEYASYHDMKGLRFTNPGAKL
jgi:D-lyxose ketol-isomerase